MSTMVQSKDCIDSGVQHVAVNHVYEEIKAQCKAAATLSTP